MRNGVFLCILRVFESFCAFLCVFPAKMACIKAQIFAELCKNTQQAPLIRPPFACHRTYIGNNNISLKFFCLKFFCTLLESDARAFRTWMSTPKCSNACFSEVSRACPKFLTRTANDPGTSAACLARKSSLLAVFSAPEKRVMTECRQKVEILNVPGHLLIQKTAPRLFIASRHFLR